MSYTIIKDGEILRVVNCRAARIESHLQEGETYLEGVYAKGEHRIGGRGQPVKLRKAERDAAVNGSRVDQRKLVRALVRDLRAAGVPMPTVSKLLEGE